MTGAEHRAARAALGFSAASWATFIALGANGGRTVRRWEADESPIPGAVALLMHLLVTCPAARRALGVAIIKQAS